MTDPEQELLQRLEALRESFDRSFERPVAPHQERGGEFLIVSAGATRYAVGLGALVRVEKGRKIVPLPLPVAGLLGLAAFDGLTIPVFSLASLLGFGEVPRGEPWLCVCQANEYLGLAFEELYGIRRVEPSDICAVASPEQTSIGSPGVFTADGLIVRVIDVASLLALASHRLKQS